MNKKLKINFGFTTVELLVAVTVLAILAILVVTVINPIDLLKQGKDSNRVASLNAVNNALRFLTENEPGTFIGTSSVVYVSIPSTVANCSNLGLPTLPSGWAYNCVTSENLRKIDGTGWIPVNFSSLPAGSPISELPVDSKNSTSTRNYFTYVASGSSWELAFAPEAEKNKLGGANNLTTKDGGQKASLFEIGKDLSLLPLDYGDSSLVGYWNFEEATGTIAYDRSGNGANGTSTSVSWQSGCLISNCTSYAGAGRIDVGNRSIFQLTKGTISAWINTANAGANYRAILAKQSAYGMFLNNNEFGIYDWGGTGWRGSGVSLNDGMWHNVACSFSSGVSNGVKCYVDGQLKLTTSMTISNQNVTLYIGEANAAQYFNGLIDDVRVYNREFSAAEVQAMYSSTR